MTILFFQPQRRPGKHAYWPRVGTENRKRKMKSKLVLKRPTYSYGEIFVMIIDKLSLQKPYTRHPRRKTRFSRSVVVNRDDNPVTTTTTTTQTSIMNLRQVPTYVLKDRRVGMRVLKNAPDQTVPPPPAA